MRKLIITLTIPVVIFSCKKENVNPAEVRLQRVESYNGNGISVSTIFNYNQQGQITSVSSAPLNGASSVSATITYNGSNIIITPTPIASAGVDASSEIRYTLNASGQPLQRIEKTIFIFKPPGFPQYDLTIDTINYEYSGDFLVKTKGGFYDSTWSNTGSVEMRITKGTFNATYTNTGNKLTQINKNTNSILNVNNSNGAFISPNTKAETITFGYTKGYSNKTDFTNSLLLTEYGALIDKIYPVNKAYENFPDKITYTSTATSGSGQPTIDNETTNTTIAFNRYGFISSIDYGQQYLTNVVYNK